MNQPTGGIAVTRDADVLVLTIDNPPVNASSATVRHGILAGLATLVADDSLAGGVLIGAHDTFVSGSDMSEFTGTVPEPLLPSVIEAIESCAKPVVAALDGNALGGGLELALGCDARVATARCLLGLPETTLGLVPGAGGTQRLPRLVGRSKALDLILTGRRIDAVAAERIGMVDAVVAESQLLATAISRARHTGKRVIASIPVPDEPDEDLDATVARVLHTKRHRPHVTEAIRLVRQAGTQLIGSGLADERATFDRLRVSDEAAALRHVFFAERVAGKPQVADATSPRQVHNVGVIGAGTMGTGIANAFAQHGYDTSVVDTDPDALARGLERAEAQLNRAVDKGRLRAEDAAAAMARLHPASQITELSECDLVVEAVIEDFDVKGETLAEGARVAANAVLASNTSYLNLDSLAVASGAADRVVGMHFFHPVHAMRLVEVVRGGHTSEQTLLTATRVARDLGKQAVLAGVGEGFIVNRIYAAYRRHAEYLLEDGALPEQVDAAMSRFGFPMGPFAVADMSGLQIARALRQKQRAEGTLPGRYVDIPDLLCDAGRFGRRTGKGYYSYHDENGDPVPDPEVAELIVAESARKGIERRDIDDDEIVDRCAFAMVHEARLVLAAGIAARPDDIDVALIYGIGFPRHLGGPLWWADQQPERRVNAGLAAVDAASRG